MVVSRRVVRRSAVAGWILLALAVGACSAPDPVGQLASKPVATPTALGTSAPSTPLASTSPSPTVAVTTAPTASARALPAAARAHTSKGAEAFARYYLDQVNKSWIQADPTLLDGLAATSCKTCANYLATARSLKKDQLHYDGAPITVGTSIELPETTVNNVFFHFFCAQAARGVRRSDGHLMRRVDREPFLGEVRMRWSSGGWHMHSMKIVQA